MLLARSQYLARKMAILRPEFPTREEPIQHWIIYTNAGYFLVRCTENQVWKRQQAYVAKHREKGARLDQIVFNYQPVKLSPINAIK